MELLNTKLSQWELRDLAVTCEATRLPSVRHDQLKTLPDVSAIYFFVFCDRVAYVGHAARLLKRFPAHHHMWWLARAASARVSYLIVPDELVLRKRIEKAFIKALNPPLNTCHRSKPVAYDDPFYGAIRAV